MGQLITVLPIGAFLLCKMTRVGEDYSGGKYWRFKVDHCYG
ncbi:MAG: hypothetical protein ACUVUB_03790 [Candidatus Bathyarchaeia archaeon]